MNATDIANFQSAVGELVDAMASFRMTIATLRTGKVTESIYSSKSVIVPLADVQHIEKWRDGQLIVVTKHTVWDFDRDFWANNINISAEEADAFRAAWSRYRSELEADTLADLSS